MILTLADATKCSAEDAKKQLTSKKSTKTRQTEAQGKKWLAIHGGKNLTHLLATARRFIFRNGMPLATTEFKDKQISSRRDWKPSWEDENLKVWAMVVSQEQDVQPTRKRSHDEFTETQTGSIPKEDETQFDEIRKGVVSAMFDSDWRLDTLTKKKLSQVKLPAAIFYRNAEGIVEKYEGPTNVGDPTFQDIEVLVRNPWPGAMIESLPHTTPSTTSVCYIIKNHPQRGKFDPKKAMELGVPKGKDFASLTGGNNITTPNGDVVTPDMVMGPGKVGGGFALVEIPNQDYIASLIAREEWSSEEVMLGVEAVVWNLGPGVLNDPRLQKFMQDRKDLKHIVSSQDCCSNYLALESPASAAVRLNAIDSWSYPIPKFSNANPSQLVADSPNYEKARIGMTLQLEPKVEVQTENVVKYVDLLAAKDEMPKEVLELAEIARKQVSTKEYQAELEENQADIPCKDAEIIALGTGSALPSKYRNVSATLVRIPEYGNFLFDCGENTLGQLKRVFGDELPDVLRNLKAIWISHLHADHHLGTASVLKAWNEETRDHESLKNSNIVVASDDGMLSWLEEYSDIEDFGYDRIKLLAMNEEFGYSYRPKPQEVKDMGFTRVEACPVTHCHGAMAVAFTFENGFKIAYSGDCRPSYSFANIGKNATLLIHEATFDDELQGDAYAKKHSTTSEALDIGKRMNARRILLTHFSQRYQKVPVMDSHGGKAQVAIVAFDYMKVRLGDFARMEAFKPALMKLYEEKEED